jgi:hypothetical protein
MAFAQQTLLPVLRKIIRKETTMNELGESQTTTDHEVIRTWAEERGGRPAQVSVTGDGEVGILRIEFPDYPENRDEALEPISWDEFFDKFEKEKLAFLYQDTTAGGEQSRFFKFINR